MKCLFFNGRYVPILALKRLVKKNFNILMEIKKNTFFGNSTPEHLQKFILQFFQFFQFFSWEIFYSKVTSKVPRMKDAQTYSEPCQASKVDLFREIVNDFWLLTIFLKSFILDIRLALNMPLGSSVFHEQTGL